MNNSLQEKDAPWFLFIRKQGIEYSLFPIILFSPIIINILFFVTIIVVLSFSSFLVASVVAAIVLVVQDVAGNLVFELL